MATKATILGMCVFASIVFLPAADASVTVSIAVPQDYSVGWCIPTPVGCRDVPCLPPLCVESGKPELAVS